MGWPRFQGKINRCLTQKCGKVQNKLGLSFMVPDLVHKLKMIFLMERRQTDILTWVKHNVPDA